MSRPWIDPTAILAATSHYAAQQPRPPPETYVSREFDRIAVALFFNRGHYEACDHVMALYRDVFPNLFLVGPRPAPHLEDAARRCNVIVSESYSETEERRAGFTLQGEFAKFMRDHPGFEGYFLGHEDVFINAPRILSWVGFPDVPGSAMVMFHSDASGASPLRRDFKWAPWPSHFGFPAVKRLQLDHRFAAFEQNFGALVRSHCHDQWPMAWSDFVYIPGRLAPLASEFLWTTFEADLFMELALPAFFHCLLPALNETARRGLVGVVNFYFHVQGTFLPKTFDFYWREVSRQAGNATGDLVDVVHPTKFSLPNVWPMVAGKMDQLLRAACQDE